MLHGTIVFKDFITISNIAFVFWFTKKKFDVSTVKMVDCKINYIFSIYLRGKEEPPDLLPPHRLSVGCIPAFFFVSHLGYAVKLMA